MQITPLYTAVLGLLFIGLSVRTLRLRRRLRIGIGDQGNPVMLRAMRVHANFAEYVPITLLSLMMLEIQRAPNLLVHVLGIALVLGRCSHAVGVSKESENYRYRVFGMTMTFTALGTSAAYLLINSVTSLAR